jgi:hypothetical protein
MKSAASSDPLDRLSINVDAEVAAMNNPAPSEPVDSSATPDENVAESDSESAEVTAAGSKFFGNDKAPESDDESEGEVEAAAPVSSVRKVKADGEWQEVADKDIDSLLSMGLGARRVFSERDKLRKDNQRLVTEVKQAAEIRSAWDKLEAAKDDPEALFRLITGGKELKEYAQSYAERARKMEQASPEERRAYELEEQLAAERKEKAQILSQAERRSQAEQERAEAARQQEVKSIATPAWKTSLESLAIDDPEAKSRVGKALWRDTWAEIESLQDAAAEAGGELELTDELIRKEFEKTAKALNFTIKTQANKQVKQVVEAKKTAAKQTAQIAASQNYRDSVDPKLARMSPMEILKHMTQRK